MNIELVTVLNVGLILAMGVVIGWVARRCAQ